MMNANKDSKQQCCINTITTNTTDTTCSNSSTTSTTKTQRMRSATVTALLAATALSNGILTAEAFSLPSHQFRTQQTAVTATALFVKKERRSESRYGVRRRVRSVLNRAKNRTGIRNTSDYLDAQIRLEEEREANSKMSIFNIEGTSTGSSSENNYSFGIATEEEFMLDVNVDVNVDVNANSDVNANEQKLPETQANTSSLPAETPESDADVNTDADPDPVQVNGGSESTANTSTLPVSKTIDPDSSVNIIAEAASIGGIGSDEIGYTSNETTTTTTTTKTAKKSKPASTYSNTSSLKPFPGDDLIPSRQLTEIDAIRGDVPAAFSMPPPPLPFTLPEITKQQKKLLRDGERVEFQSDMGREGSGFVVMDVKAPSVVVWECLLDFYSYPQTIPTVRDVQMFTNTHLNADIYSEEAVERQKYEDGTLATLKHGVPSVTRAAFTLSKFRLKIAAIHKYRPHPRGDYMVFTLDPSCTNLVLKNAKGVWHTQSNPDGRGDEYTRVWLLCELGVSPLLPQWITDYAAKRAMPRASSWVKPHVEAAAELWFKGLKD